jgi:hypothetical protein
MQQAAAMLGVSEMVVRRLIAHEILPAKRRVHEGRRTGWAVSDKQKGLFADTHEAWP